jgi:hypothetical protein
MTELEEKLMAIAFRDVSECMKSAVLENFGQQKLYDPGAYDWQHYVDANVRTLWGGLDLGQKLVAYILASQRAEDVDDPD